RFSERIRAAIDAEPTVHASPTRAARSWQKPAIGFALAASVAAMAVITLQPWNADPATSPLASSDASEPRVAQASAPAADNRTAERLNDYLVSHSSLASMNSVYGVLPYVRMASHTGGR
ncbi:MAG: hypothetical protein R3202_10125, partial [Candidatus Competibacterales bacterium]|nr:hypothetical protein [Candidatus Competibacterales bacterium]